jgi:uncharacterized protein YjbI with pentapeptide repeats
MVKRKISADFVDADGDAFMPHIAANRSSVENRFCSSAKKSRNDKIRRNNFVQEQKELLERILINFLMLRSYIDRGFEQGNAISNAKLFEQFLGNAKQEAIANISNLKKFACALNNAAKSEPFVKKHFQDITGTIGEATSLKQFIDCEREKINTFLDTNKTFVQANCKPTVQTKNEFEIVNNSLARVQTHMIDALTKLLRLLELLFKKVREYPLELEKAQLEKAQLEKAQLEKAQLEKAQLEKAQLEKAQLEKDEIVSAELASLFVNAFEYKTSDLIDDFGDMLF